MPDLTLTLEQIDDITARGMPEDMTDEERVGVLRLARAMAWVQEHGADIVIDGVPIKVLRFHGQSLVTAIEDAMGKEAGR